MKSILFVISLVAIQFFASAASALEEQRIYISGIKTDRVELYQKSTQALYVFAMNEEVETTLAALPELEIDKMVYECIAKSAQGRVRGISTYLVFTKLYSLRNCVQKNIGDLPGFR